MYQFCKTGGREFIVVIMFYYSFNKKRINFVDRFVYSYIVARLLREISDVYIYIYIFVMYCIDFYAK